MENPKQDDNGESDLKQIESLFKKNNICSCLIEGFPGVLVVYCIRSIS